MSRLPSASPRIVHSLPIWLSTTMIWVYTQIRNTPDTSPLVLVDRLDHPEQFPMERLYTPRRPMPPRLVSLQRRLGVRFVPANYRTLLDTERPALLHSHFGDRAWFDLPLARRYRLPHVVTFYGYDISMLPRSRPYWRRRYRELFRRADLFLCEGEFMAARLADLGCPPEKVRVQRLGVEVGEIAFAPRRRQAGEPLRVLIAGSFREKKGIPYALEAIGMLAARGVPVEVTVIGDSSGTPREQAEKRAILDVIRRYNLEPATRMLGYRPYAELLAQAYAHHIFLSPSVTAGDGDSEGGAPVSLIDMAASGMPIISTRHCDIPGVVIHGANGLLAEERDAPALADHLAWMADHPERWEAMGWAGRQHIETNFDAQKQGAALGARYHSLIT
ncbi:glycosyltransferase [Oscillochloris sp. ZM17-4]|uniref:glycosyltransferase n=1 Tax=Oscillochloris sp. ZM17-4 TaxID=2866714 RepID=UPI001C739F6E|nr:glycosyltransferase [Oscillochloris sp. ZM17-4]MBX0330766.1 glycosyltransferase [Oscillochloris sp. ZM17-4]